MSTTLESLILKLLNERLCSLEKHFVADVLTYFGPFIDTPENKTFLKRVEDLAGDENEKDKIYIVLTTYGGSVQVVERFVNVLRNHYKEVHFIVPDYAYSAGTIFCMSGDSILVDYYSVLGPIDPQVQNREGELVPALGYLDKINELLEKAQSNTLTQAELLILKSFDLATLRRYEQARDLAIELLKNWLVKYKFKNWNTHRSNTEKLNEAVTLAEKEERAEEIAEELSDNNKWKTHGRPINIEAFKELRLEIEDYSNENERRKLIREYYDLLSDYLKNKPKDYIFVQTRKFI